MPTSSSRLRRRTRCPARFSRAFRLFCAPAVVLGMLGASPPSAHADDDCSSAPLLPIREFATGGGPDELAIGDVNGDKISDLVVAVGQNVSVLFGRGAGTYDPAQSYGGSTLAGAFVALGDIDGDGDLDIATSAERVKFVHVLFNDGHGVFTIGPTYTVVEGDSTVGAFQLAFGDLDADGDFDLAVNTSFHVAVLLNDGSGALAVRRDLPNAEGRTLRLADLDGDHDLDIVTCSSPRFRVTRNNGNATFRAPVSYQDSQCTFSGTHFCLGDFDHDGDLDIAVNADCQGGVNVRRNNGSGAFGPLTTFSVPRTPKATLGLLAAADFDGDGTLDLAMSSAYFSSLGPHDCTISILHGIGDATFAAAQPYRTATVPKNLYTLDVDADNDADIVFPTYYAGVGVMQNNGDGTFPSRADYPTAGFDPRSAALGDLDGDGDLDIVTPNAGTDDLTVYTNAGGTLVNRTNYVTTDQPWAVALGDLDADGDLDAAIAHRSSATPVVEVRFNLGGGVFGPGTTYTVSTSTNSIALADIDRDGDLDMAATTTGGGLRVWKNNGNGTFGTAVGYGVGSGASSVQFADFDSDGDVDICAVTASEERVSVRLNSGSGAFGPETTYTMPDPPFSLDVGDMDQDGDLDIAVACFDNHFNVCVLKNNGNATFAPRVDYPAIRPAWVRLADLDNDGDLDAVTADTRTTVSVFSNDGSGALFDRAEYAVEYNTVSVTLADMNLDGNIDIVSTSLETENVSILPNVGVYAPLITRDPSPATACPSDAVTFTAAAIGSHPLSFQWRKDAVDIPGATSATLTIPSVTPADAGPYSVAVTNPCRTIVSAAASLTVGGRADWNHDGATTKDDVTAFIADWHADQAKGTLITDFIADGLVNSTDVSDFINAWFEDTAAGC